MIEKGEQYEMNQDKELVSEQQTARNPEEQAQRAQEMQVQQTPQTQDTQQTQRVQDTQQTQQPQEMQQTQDAQRTQQPQDTQQTQDAQRTQQSQDMQQTQDARRTQQPQEMKQTQDARRTQQPQDMQQTQDIRLTRQPQDTSQRMEFYDQAAFNFPAEQHNPVHAPIPGLGLRSLKTALAVVFTALFYAFFQNSNPTFACIGAIFGMGSDMQESRRSGGNRFFGTIIGGFIGLGLYWMEHQIFPEGCYWLRMPLVFVGIIIMISLCVLFRWPGGVQPGGVVLCIILFNTPAHHIGYAVSRMIDTGVGVVIALLVNYLLPRSRLERWFHLSKNRKDVNGSDS